MAMEFLPQPKRVEARSGALTLTPHTRIVLRPGTAPEALVYAQMLRDAVHDQAGLCPALGRGEAAPGDIALCIDTDLPAAHYKLKQTARSFCILQYEAGKRRIVQNAMAERPRYCGMQ